LLANSAATPSIRVAGITLGVLGILLSIFLAVFPEIAANFVEALKVRAGHQKMSLAELREDITKQLERLRHEGRTVLVIIDDIDRLSQEEIRFLFQLIKANTNFPNMVFLLLFQKDIIVAALSKLVADRGSEYLKKIVQVEIDVPHAPRARMLKIFQEDLNRIFGNSPAKMYWDKIRMQRLFEDNLWPYFRTMRDVKRFIGTFDFYYTGHINQGVLEVNPIDLLSIEILRTFDHEAFVTARDSLGYSSQSDIVRALMADEEYEKQMQRHIDVLLSRPNLKSEEKERLSAILINLFPKGKVEEAKFERDLRICHPKHFHKYFEHALDDSPTSAANVEGIIRLVSDRPAFAKRLRELSKSGTVEEVFEKLGIYFEGVPVSAARSFISALFDVGEELPGEHEGLFNQDPIYTACRLIYLILKKMPSVDERAKVLQECIDDSDGAVLPIMFVAFLQRRKGDESGTILLDDARIEPLKLLSLEKLRAIAHTGAIWQSRHFATLIRIWREWSGDALVREWLTKELTTPEKALDFLAKFVGSSMSGGELFSYLFSAKWMEGIISLEDIDGKIGELNGKTASEQAAKRLLSLALDLKRAGHAYEQVELHRQSLEDPRG